MKKKNGPKTLRGDGSGTGNCKATEAPDPLLLEDSEIDAYLAFQFRALARKPLPLKVPEVAAVARRLEWLGISAQAKPVLNAPSRAGSSSESSAEIGEEEARRRFRECAAHLWTTTLRFAPIPAATTGETTAFLRKHSAYWPAEHLEMICKLLKTFEVPDTGYPVLPPTLHNNSLAIYRLPTPGTPKFRASNDLTDRIVAADQALQISQVPKRHQRIADALDKSGIKPKGTSKRAWDPEDVSNRLKIFQRRRGKQEDADSLGRISILNFRQAREFPIK